ncbi:MAG: phage tail protein, partial [Planctomycetota bacterium]
MSIFGQGDIVPDSLQISYTGKDQIPNSLEGDILDSQANFERRTVLVDHPSIQNPTTFDTIRKERVEFFGVTRRSQALRDATYRLNQAHSQMKSVAFQVGPDAVHLLPGDRFKLSHDVPEYGLSGRLRNRSVIANFFPNAGSFYSSWDAQGGTCSLSSYLLAEETTDSKPAGFLQSQVAVTHMWAVPTGPSGSELAKAGGHDGSDYGTGYSPSAFGQHVATSNVLYPPSTTLGPLDLIRDVASFTAAYSVFVKEPAKGAAKTIYVNFYRLVDQAGTPINHTNLAIFDWSSGALSVTSSDASIASTVDAIGGGWYRIKCVYTAASDTGAEDFDFLQVRTYVQGQGTGGVWKKVADGGRGINFLKYADPLDVTFSDWTLNNGTGTSSNAIANTSVEPPFYSATDGSYGYVVKLAKAGQAVGTETPTLIQSTTLLPGSLVTTWNGER